MLLAGGRGKMLYWIHRRMWLTSFVRVCDASKSNHELKCRSSNVVKAGGLCNWQKSSLVAQGVICFGGACVGSRGIGAMEDDPTMCKV